MKLGVWPLKILISYIDQLENGGEKNPLISMEELARPKSGPSSQSWCVIFKTGDVLLVTWTLRKMKVPDTKFNWIFTPGLSLV